MSLLDALGTFVGGGGLAGAIGAATSAVAKYKERKLANAHEQAMAPHRERQWQFELAVMRRQSEHEAAMAEHDLAVTIEHGAMVTRQEAIRADGDEAVAALSMTGQRWWVGAIRTLFRPFLTLLLWSILMVMWYRSVPNGDLENLLALTVANGAGLSLGVWFGGRVTPPIR